MALETMAPVMEQMPRVAEQASSAPTGILVLIIMAVVGIIALAVSAVVYFLPTIIALKRNTSNKTAAILVDIFLGWSFVGWIIALVLSLTGVKLPKNK